MIVEHWWTSARPLSERAALCDRDATRDDGSPDSDGDDPLRPAEAEPIA